MLKKTYHKIIKSMYDWAMKISAGNYAVWGLCIVSFIESSFFPIPPDLLLIPMILATPKKAFRLAFLCTLFSVLGGYFGYYIGWALDEPVLQPILQWFGWEEAFQSFKGWYHEYGAWIVFMAGLTPFPYKIVTIASGAVGLNLFVFTIASILSRGGRFFIVAWLLHKWGEPMKKYIEKNLNWLSILFVVLLFGSIALLKLF